MDSHRRRWSLERTIVVGAIALGVAGGSYGVASAASGSSSGSGSAAAAPSARQPWGPQRSDEAPLTGDTAARSASSRSRRCPAARSSASRPTPTATPRTRRTWSASDGSPVTVYVSKQLEVVSVQSGMPHPPGGARLAPTGASA